VFNSGSCKHDNVKFAFRLGLRGDFNDWTGESGCEESISNGLSKHGIHFGIYSCVIEHWSFKKGVRGEIM
jgi:hypothetical protein